MNGSLTFDRSDHDIPWGYTYYVFEQAAPTGYDLMTPNPIVVDATAKPSGQDPTLAVDATDPQKPSTLKVIKHDAQTGDVVDGASFDLYRNTNGSPVSRPRRRRPPADQIVGSCGPTTGGNPCSVGNLVFGTYWWYETAAPDRLRAAVAADRPSSPITVDADNAGSTFDVTVIEDPEIPGADQGGQAGPGHPASRSVEPPSGCTPTPTATTPTTTVSTSSSTAAHGRPRRWLHLRDRGLCLGHLLRQGDGQARPLRLRRGSA